MGKDKPHTVSWYSPTSGNIRHTLKNKADASTFAKHLKEKGHKNVKISEFQKKSWKQRLLRR